MNETEQLIERFPLLAELDMPGQAIIARAKKVKLPANHIVFRQGDQCSHYIIVVAGTVKVLGRSESGREIVLYRIEQQGSCVLTTSCLLAGDAYPAEGIAETDVTAYLISLPDFQQALAESEALRHFIFESYGERLARMITLVQEIAFERIEKRLARYLLEHVGAGFVLLRSHQEIAEELGTAREVVSRQLKMFEHKGWIALSRNQVMFLSKTALETCSAA